MPKTSLVRPVDSIGPTIPAYDRQSDRQTHDESKYPAGIVKIGKSLKWLRDVDATERTPFGNLSCMS